MPRVTRRLALKLAARLALAGVVGYFAWIFFGLNDHTVIAGQAETLLAAVRPTPQCAEY